MLSLFLDSPVDDRGDSLDSRVVSSVVVYFLDAWVMILDEERPVGKLTCALTNLETVLV